MERNLQMSFMEGSSQNLLGDPAKRLDSELSGQVKVPRDLRQREGFREQRGCLRCLAK